MKLVGLIATVACVRAVILRPPLAEQSGQPVLSRPGGGSTFSPCTFLGGGLGQARFPQVDRALQCIQEKFRCNREGAVGWLATRGEPIVGTFRTQACWLMHDAIVPIDEECMWSCAAEQCPERLSILECVYEVTHISALAEHIPGGLDLPIVKSLTGEFMNGAIELGAIGGDASRLPYYSEGWLSEASGMEPGALCMMSVFATISSPQNLANAVKFAHDKGFGPSILAACIFGGYQDVLAQSGSLPARAYGNYDLYRQYALPTLEAMLGDLKNTCWGVNDLQEFWSCSGIAGVQMCVRLLDSGLTWFQGQVVRRSSPPLLLGEFPSQLRGQFQTFVPINPTGVSWKNLEAIYGTPLHALMTVGTRMVTGGGTYKPEYVGDDIERQTCARDIFKFGMGRLLHFLGRYSRNEHYAFRVPDLDDPEPKPEPYPWISLVFTFVPSLCVYFACKIPSSLKRDDDQAVRRASRDYFENCINASSLQGQEKAYALLAARRVCANRNIKFRVSDDGAGIFMEFTASTRFQSIGGAFPPLPRTIAGLEAQGVSLRDVAQALVRNSPYIRPGTDGGDDDPALNDDVPQDRWPGLATRDDMRDEANKGRPSDLRDA